MLYEFLDTNRTAVVERWRHKAARRRAPRPAIAGALDLAIRNSWGRSSRPFASPTAPECLASRNPRPPTSRTSEIAAVATEHGRELLVDGFTIEQVVHDYGDLGQAVAELAGERAISISPEELRPSACASTRPSPMR
jgi:hypothetical protein